MYHEAKTIDEKCRCATLLITGVRKRRFSNCCRTTRKGDLRTAIIMGMDPEPVANGERERIMMNDDERGKCETAVANNSQDAYFLLLSSIRSAAFCVCFSSHN